MQQKQQRTRQVNTRERQQGFMKESMREKQQGTRQETRQEMWQRTWQESIPEKQQETKRMYARKVGSNQASILAKKQKLSMEVCMQKQQQVTR